MDRRKFMGMFTGGLVATATMAEAELLADFFKWLKKGPTDYSFAMNIKNEFIDWKPPIAGENGWSEMPIMITLRLNYREVFPGVAVRDWVWEPQNLQEITK